MNYQKIYDDICKRGQERELPKEVYTEKHHIVPKCMEGTNEKSNLTVLTAREHFLVHYILAEKLYPTNPKLWFALWKMLHGSRYHKRFIPNSRTYEDIKMSWNEFNRGENHPSFGKCGELSATFGFKHSEETKQQMSIVKKELMNDDIKRHLSEVLTGIKRTPEANQKRSERMIGEGNHNFGKKFSEMICLRISEGHKGDKNGMFGKNHTPEVRELISEKNKGKTVSEETRQRMSEVRKGKTILKKCSPCVINGIYFESIISASKILDINKGTIAQRLHSKSPKWDDWKFKQ